MSSSTIPVVAPRAPVSSVLPADQQVLVTTMQRLSAAWAQGDAATLADLYAEDASVVLPGDTYLKGRAEIQKWMGDAFEGKWKGTKVLGVPLELRYLQPDVAMMISHGGAYKPGATEVSVEDAIRGIWLFTKTAAGWTIAAYENTPVRATIPIPATNR
jgi:uncharacterized protein (TIGR02246 family)